MALEGGCYCRNLRYLAQGEAAMKVQCHCRECQYVSGGGANFTIGISESCFAYTRGVAKRFCRTDLLSPATREFCPDCGTQLASRTPAFPGFVFIKVGTLDDPKLFGSAQLAIYAVDKQPFHYIPDGMPCFERLPE